MTAAPGARVAVDVALFTVRDDALHVLVVQTAGGPFAGAWALPGGLVRENEPLDDAAARELFARTGVGDAYLEQLYTFGSPDRDPHARVVSVAYVGLIPHGGRFAGTLEHPKYRQVVWCPVRRSPPLAYDHAEVVRTAVARVRAKLAYTNLVYTLLPPTFTLSELQAVYQAILGRRLDRRNFRKKMLSTGLLAALGRERRGAHRPAALYRFRRRRPATVAML
ncbi:MAG TPA: NUDIX domain-containing protein [Candidatus Eisenbacteria bacterium]|nr:NUDIX domain-containing protein [Candidatus Eisenbacteria bacterium]